MKQKPPLRGVFIEADWPEFEPVIRMIAKRMGEDPKAQIEANREYIAYWQRQKLKAGSKRKSSPKR